MNNESRDRYIGDLGLFHAEDSHIGHSYMHDDINNSRGRVNPGK